MIFYIIILLIILYKAFLRKSTQPSLTSISIDSLFYSQEKFLLFFFITNSLLIISFILIPDLFLSLKSSPCRCMENISDSDEEMQEIVSINHFLRNITVAFELDFIKRPDNGLFYHFYLSSPHFIFVPTTDLILDLNNLLKDLFIEKDLLEDRFDNVLDDLDPNSVFTQTNSYLKVGSYLNIFENLLSDINNILLIQSLAALKLQPFYFNCLNTVNQNVDMLFLPSDIKKHIASFLLGNLLMNYPVYSLEHHSYMEQGALLVEENLQILYQMNDMSTVLTPSESTQTLLEFTLDESLIQTGDDGFNNFFQQYLNSLEINNPTNIATQIEGLYRVNSPISQNVLMELNSNKIQYIYNNR